MFDWFKRYRQPLLLGVLLLAALLLYSAQLRQRRATTLFERVVLQATAPFQRGVEQVCNALYAGWNHYFWLVDTARENERLVAENRRLRAELEEVREVRLANERLRELLAFREELNLPAVPARIIAEDASSWFRTVMIDKGLEDGLRESLPVVAAEGVVGRVIKVANRQARVLLVTDASSAVAALVQHNRTRGVARGQGEWLTLEFAVRQQEVRPGDLVVTSGTGGVFPKGLPLGEVSLVERDDYGLFQTVTVTPVVDFSRLEEVLVLRPEAP